MCQILVVILCTEYVAFSSLGYLADGVWSADTVRVASVPSDDDHVRLETKAVEDKRLYLISWHFQALFLLMTLCQGTLCFVMWCLYCSPISFHLSLFFHFYYLFSFSVSSASTYVPHLFISFFISFFLFRYRLSLFLDFLIYLSTRTIFVLI